MTALLSSLALISMASPVCLVYAVLAVLMQLVVTFTILYSTWLMSLLELLSSEWLLIPIQ